MNWENYAIGRLRLGKDRSKKQSTDLISTIGFNKAKQDTMKDVIYELENRLFQKHAIEVACMDFSDDRGKEDIWK